MNTNLAVRSIIFFGLSILLFVAFTALESSIGVLPLLAERVITFLAFVLPAGMGVWFGVTSLVRREGRPWLPLIGILLNSVFAIFHLMIIFMAG